MTPGTEMNDGPGEAPASDPRDAVGYDYVCRGFLSGLREDEGFARLLASWADDAGVWAAAADVARTLREFDSGAAGTDHAARIHIAAAEFEARLASFLSGDRWEAELGLILEERELTAGWLGELVKDACLSSVATFVTADGTGDAADAIREAAATEIERLDEELARPASAEVMGERRRASYEQYGQWLYLSAIREQPKRIIARASLGSVNQTSQVRYGLRRAREFLAAGESTRPLQPSAEAESERQFQHRAPWD